MKKHHINLGLTVIGAIVTGLTGFFAYQWNLIKNIDFTVGKVSLIGITGQNVKLRLFLNLENKSSVDVFVDEYDIDIFVNGTNVGKLDYHKKQYIKAKGITQLELVFVIPFKQYFNISDALQMVGYFLNDKSKINIALKGNLKARHWKFNFDVPIDVKWNLSEFFEDKK
jgi:LEA14-like dessication related protein